MRHRPGATASLCNVYIVRLLNGMRSESNSLHKTWQRKHLRTSKQSTNDYHYRSKLGLLEWYLRTNEKRPFITAVVTAAGLWSVGDILAQQISLSSSRLVAEATPSTGSANSSEGEDGQQGAERKIPVQLDVRRLIGTTAEGCLISGGMGFFWYRFLDRAVTSMGYKAGTLRFVAAKLGLEMAIWHPFSLAAFWVLLGVWNGHPHKQIKSELGKEFLPTLASEIALWTTLDIINFWKVPVRLQVIVASLGGLVEAILLSYVHERGFPGFIRGPDKVDPGIMHDIVGQLQGFERFEDG
jgi:hypothetical protein